MARRLRKLSYDGEKVLVRFEQTRLNGEPDEFETKCSDKPAPELIAALAALRSHVGHILELPPAYTEGLVVRGVSLGYGGETEVMGATITALRTLQTARAPLVLNTPFLPSAPYSETGDPGPLLPETCTDALRKVEAEAFRYVDGHRAQGDLFAAPAVVEAVRDLCPEPGSGIESVTISAAGHEPVTLTAETREKADRALAAMGAESGWGMDQAPAAEA